MHAKDTPMLKEFNRTYDLHNPVMVGFGIGIVGYRCEDCNAFAFGPEYPGADLTNLKPFPEVCNAR